MSLPGPRVLGLDDISAVLRMDLVMRAVRESLEGLWRGRIQCPAPTHLQFDAPRGDCHVKVAKEVGGARFSVKIATGFYDNPSRNMPVNNGMVFLFDATTGAPIAILEDQGWLTSWRTAAAGALAAQAIARPGCRLGIIGTGHQAKLQAAWISRALDTSSIRVWGRSHSAAIRVSEDLRSLQVEAIPVPTREEVIATSDLLVLCTSASVPLIAASDLSPGKSVLSIGADGPEKSEIAADVFSLAAVLVTDDHAQCLAGGDFGKAIACGAIEPDSDISLGMVLEQGGCLRGSDDEIVVATLTGSGAQDLAIAGLAADLLASRGRRRTEAISRLETLD